MGKSMSAQGRTQTLDRLRDYIEQQFGLSQGKKRRLFRKVIRGPWNPDATSLPRLTVADSGQRREPGGDFETENMVLSTDLVLEFGANWDRQKENDDWTDNVQMLITTVSNWTGGGAGTLRMRYVDDEPWDVNLTDGKTVSIWIVRFEHLSAVDVLDLGVE
jgi:hypothetical protein